MWLPQANVMVIRITVNKTHPSTYTQQDRPSLDTSSSTATAEGPEASTPHFPRSPISPHTEATSHVNSLPSLWEPSDQGMQVACRYPRRKGQGALNQPVGKLKAKGSQTGSQTTSLLSPPGSLTGEFDHRAVLSFLRASCNIHFLKGEVGEGHWPQACLSVPWSSINRGRGLLIASGKVPSMPGLLARPSPPKSTF